MRRPIVNKNKCVACYECTYVCPVDAINISSKTHKAYIHPKRCQACYACIGACPTHAIIEG
jgi:NAD-dependent dihydropyrimidine dehydrogenase PreA subunit